MPVPIGRQQPCSRHRLVCSTRDSVLSLALTTFRNQSSFCSFSGQVSLLELLCETSSRGHEILKVVRTDGTTPAILAAPWANGGHLAVLEFLAHHHRNSLMAKTKAGWTTVASAVYYGYLDLLQWLLAQMDHPREFLGVREVRLAVQRGRLDILKVILDQNPDQSMWEAADREAQDGSEISQWLQSGEAVDLRTARTL